MIIKYLILLASFCLFSLSCSTQGLGVRNGLRDKMPYQPIDSMVRACYLKPNGYIDTAVYSRSKRYDAMLEYTFTPDSLFDGFWVGDYQLPFQRGSRYGVSMRIDSTIGDSVFGSGVFTTSGGVDLSFSKSLICMRAKKVGSRLEGQIAEYWEGQVNSYAVYYISFNYYKVSTMPDTTWARADVIGGHAERRWDTIAYPGYFIFHKPHRKDFVPAPFLLPENVYTKDKWK